MERLTTLSASGEYASGRAQSELLAELGRYEDFAESVEAELELVRLNLGDLKAAGRQRSATYTMLMGSKYMLEEMQKRLAEPPKETAARLENLRRLIDGDDDGIRDVEE